MFIRNALLVAMALSESQIYQDTISPVPIYQAAKLLNRTDEDIDVTYQFEDDEWRRGRILSGQSLYIFDPDSKHPLSIRLQDSSGTRQFVLETNTVLSVNNLQNNEPNFRRNDQAAIYHIARHDRRNEVYRGFPPAWYQDAIASVLKKSKQREINLSLFRTTVDVGLVDPMYCHAEFERFENVVREEYVKFMQSKSTPELELRWERIGTLDHPLLTPRVVIIGDCHAGGTYFVRQLVEQVLQRSTVEMRIVTVCKAGTGTTIRRPFLNEIYIRGNTILPSRMVDDIVNELRSHTLVGAAQVVRDSPSSYTVFGRWNYGTANNSQYSWRAIVQTSIKFDDESQAGVSLGVDIEARKRYPSSSNWQYVSQFAVANLETFPETSFVVQDNVSKKKLEPLQQVSKAAQICFEVERHLADIVAPRPALPDVKLHP